MWSSVDTNLGAMVALRTLSNVNTALAETQKRIGTGFKVADPYDDGAAFAVAERIRSDIKVLGAINERLAVGRGMIDVAIKAGESISKSLQEIRSVLTKLADQSLTASDRTNYENQYNSLKLDIDNYIKSASFNGITLINTSAPQSIISSLGGRSITISAQNLASMVLDQLGNASNATAAAALIAQNGGFANAQANLGLALNQLASDARRIRNQIAFNEAISDAHEAGLGAIIDADMAKESARLQALQIRQQLATQTLALANRNSQWLLNLFR